MLNSKQKQKLKVLAHSLKPTVYIGKNGLEISVNKAVARELAAHELIKVKLFEACGISKREAAARLAEKSASELVHIIGRTIILYKKHPSEPKIKL